MKLSPESQQLYFDSRIRKVIDKSLTDAEPIYHTSTMPWGEDAGIRREGKYPLVTPEGKFEATLWRTIPKNDGEKIRGGEFRVLANRHLSREYSFLQENLNLIVDTIPSFLKELSDPHVQEMLSEARTRIFNSEMPAAMISNRASDVHDGEYRMTSSGQQDIQEEIWYAKVLTVMKANPGIKYADAMRMLINAGEKPYLADYALGFATLVQEFFYGHVPKNLDMEVLPIGDLIESFKDEGQKHVAVDQIIKFAGELPSGRVELPFGIFEGEVLADYPIIQGGIEYRARLISMQKEGASSFQTFRVLEYGDQANAYVRIDSICINGLQAGDDHCDCRRQSEIEKERAAFEIPMMLINIRDDEGKFHGEGKKGGTLAVQRAINEYLLNEALSEGRTEADAKLIGNPIASQLFYYETGEECDARSFDIVTALIAFLNLKDIPHFVTNNQEKIAAVKRVSKIHDVVTAEVFDKISAVARATKMEKAKGLAGVEYKY